MSSLYRYMSSAPSCYIYRSLSCPPAHRFLPLTCLSYVTPSTTDICRTRLPHPRTTLAGWWQSISIAGGNLCGLRDFPPRGGEGPVRILCGGYASTGDDGKGNIYSPQPIVYWTWKITKVGCQVWTWKIIQVRVEWFDASWVQIIHCISMIQAKGRSHMLRQWMTTLGCGLTFGCGFSGLLSLFPSFASLFPCFLSSLSFPCFPVSPFPPPIVLPCFFVVLSCFPVSPMSLYRPHTRQPVRSPTTAAMSSLATWSTYRASTP